MIVQAVEANPAEIPSDQEGEIVRLKITLKNSGDDVLEDLDLTDLIQPARLVAWWSSASGKVEVSDPFTGEEPTAESSFYTGTRLNWTVDQLGPHEYASLNLEVMILHALDAGWTQPLDGGIWVAYKGMDEDEDEDDDENGGEDFDEDGDGIADGPFVNITYPAVTSPGWTNLSWEVARDPGTVILNYFSPEGKMKSVYYYNCRPGKVSNATILFGKPGTWTFNLEAWTSSKDIDYRTENFTVKVRSSADPINVTAFSFTKIPKLSLISAEMAGARGGILFDAATDPQDLDPSEVEGDLKILVEELEISPEYLIVVGGPGSLPFISTGGRQESGYFEYDLYRDYTIELDDDGYQDVASGRMMGLSVYDTSQMAARTLAYDRIGGDWRNSALVISSPTDYPSSWPASPVPLRMGEYLRAAGLDAENLRWEEATSQRVASKMNSGENIVYFDYHGVEWGWKLSIWALMDQVLDEEQVKQLTLAPQTTTTSACLTSRLKGMVFPYRDGIDIYLPTRLEDSMALAFIKAGGVNYAGPSASSWIFVSDDYVGRMHQALVFENATIGEAIMAANNHYASKILATEKIDLEKIDEYQPWSISVEEMLNQTVSIFALLGDPAFRPAIPKTPDLPYSIETSNVTESNATDEVSVSITPTSEWSSDWIYWIVEDSSDGYLSLNSPATLMGEVTLPVDAEEIVVKEKGRAVWHGEETIGSFKRVTWPVLSPAVGESRNFTVEYRLIPGEVQVVNVSVGWTPFSLHLKPKDPSVAKLLDKKGYRGIFTISGDGWNYTINDDQAVNETDLVPGRGYVIDGQESFFLEIAGKPVDLPYSVELYEGWNLVGVPMNETIFLANVTVRANHKRYTYSEAVDEGIVSAFLWTYRDGSWVHTEKDEPMIPGAAYMVEAAEECKLEFG